MSSYNITNLQKILPPNGKRKVRIIFNPIFKDSEDLEEIKNLIAIKMGKIGLFS